MRLSLWHGMILFQLAAPSLATAQALAPAWQTAPEIVLPPLHGATQARPESQGPANLPDTYPRTYWKEGGAVGAAILGIVGAILADRLCGQDGANEHCSSTTLGGAAVGIGVGFGIGALIGSRFPKGS